MSLDQNPAPPSYSLVSSHVDAWKPSHEESESSFLEQITKSLKVAVQDSLFRSHLMAMVGHDLKQPLQVVSMLLDLFAPYISDPDVKPRLQLARESIDRIGQGLDRLALASTVGADVPTLRTFPVADVLRRIEPTWHEHAARKRIELRVVNSSARVTSDPAMLAAIVDNLVGNAIKYTSKGSVLVGCRRGSGQVLIQVLDTGAGIKRTQLESIFTAFHQENPESDGLGLGLSIVRYTAAALDHVIAVKSQLGKGSMFTVGVPCSAYSHGRMPSASEDALVEREQHANT